MFCALTLSSFGPPSRQRVGQSLPKFAPPRLTRGAPPPALCAASFGPPQGVSHCTFYRCTVSHGPVASARFDSNVDCIIAQLAQASEAPRLWYVARLWSGSCSPRRAISARLQAQCRPSVSPVGQSFPAVGRSVFKLELLRSSRAASAPSRPRLCSAARLLRTSWRSTGRIHGLRPPPLVVARRTQAGAAVAGAC